MKKILEGDALEQRARQLGIDIKGELITQSSSGRHRRASDYKVKHRDTSHIIDKLECFG